MRFHYVASQPDGKIVEDEIEAQGVAEVLEFLAAKNFKPIKVKNVKEIIKGRGIFGAATINTTDKIFLTRYLSLMLKVGTDLLQAIDVLTADLDKPVIKSFLKEVRSNLEKGQPFYATFVKYPRFFDQVFVSLLKAGETSGNLDQILGNISVSLSSPSNNTFTNINQTNFTCLSQTASDFNLTNISFFVWNSTDDLVYNSTKNISGRYNSTIFEYNLTQEIKYLWNCQAYNNDSQFAISSGNFTITADVTRRTTV